MAHDLQASVSLMFLAHFDVLCDLLLNKPRGVARIFQRGGHHAGIADYTWFIQLLSLVYQRAQSYYRGMKAPIN